jgi:peptidoglycan/LPS O-acetylase OafA/YrhL
MNRQIETLRGFACLLLVLYHVIGADPSNGLKISDGPIRLLNDALAYLRMPLFTFLSGMVYGLRPFGGDSRRFLVGKCRRLLIPMLVVGTFFAMVQAVTPGANAVVGNWWLLHVQPVAHFWFIESLFWVFLLVWLAERQRWIKSPVGFGVALSLACLLYLTVRGTHWFSIDGAIYLLPFFLCGLAVTRFNLWPALDRHGVQILLAVLAAVAVWQMGAPVPNPDRRTVSVLVAGVALCGLSLAPRLEVSWLGRIGRSSYAIYLFHVFFTAASRIFLIKAGLAIIPLQIVAGLVAGVIGPMVIDHFASRHRWPALLLLGKTVARTGQAGGVRAPAD